MLLACHMDPTFKDRVRTLLQPVAERLSACPICTKECVAKAKDSAAAALWFEDLVQQNRWQRIHLWIAALKLAQDPKSVRILQQQVVGEDNALGFSEPEALKMLVSPECSWDQVFSRLNRLGYVVRDLAFAGTLGIQVDVDGLIASVDQHHPDWHLLEFLESYLKITLYENIHAQTASILCQRALAALLLLGKISLGDLFGIDPASAMNDETLAKLLQRTRAGREVFDPELRTAWRTWPIECFVDPRRTPSEVEKTITGQTKLHLSSHTRTRVTCLKLVQDNSLGLAMCHRDQAKKPAAKAFIKLCRSILLREYPRLAPGGLTTALYEGLVDRTCEHGLKAAVERYGKLPVAEGILQGAAEVVNRRSIAKAPGPAVFSFRIGAFDYPMHGDPQVNIMHAALMGNDTVRKNLGLSLSEAAELLWSQILNWQSVYFGRRPSKKVLKLLDETQSLLARSVVTPNPTSEIDLELFALLEALKHPSHSVSFRMVLPNLKLLKDDKTIENEYDVVSVVLKEDKDVEVWIWGVSTEADIGRKRNADRAKIQRLKDHLGNRWGGEVKTVENYIHKDGDSICCEIEGRQYKRRIT